VHVTLFDLLTGWRYMLKMVYHSSVSNCIFLDYMQYAVFHSDI